MFTFWFLFSFHLLCMPVEIGSVGAFEQEEKINTHKLQITASSVSPTPLNVLPTVFLSREADVTCQQPLWANQETFWSSVQGLDKRGLRVIRKGFCQLVSFTKTGMGKDIGVVVALSTKIYQVYAHILPPHDCWENCCGVWICVSLLASTFWFLSLYTVEMKPLP